MVERRTIHGRTGLEYKVKRDAVKDINVNRAEVAKYLQVLRSLLRHITRVHFKLLESS